MFIALLMLVSICPLTVFAEGENQQSAVDPAAIEAARIAAEQAAAAAKAAKAAEEAAAVAKAAEEAAAAAKAAEEAAVAAKAAEEHVHNYVLVKADLATCSEPGGQIFVCTGCGDTYYNLFPIDPSAHNYQNGVCIHCGAVMPVTVESPVEEVSAETTVTEVDEKDGEEKETTGILQQGETEVDNTEASSDTGESTKMLKSKPALSMKNVQVNKIAEEEKDLEENSEENSEKNKDVENLELTEEDEQEPLSMKTMSGPLKATAQSNTVVPEDPPSISFIYKDITILDWTMPGIEITGDPGADTLKGKTSETEGTSYIETAIQNLGISAENVKAVVVNAIKTIGEFAFSGLKNLQLVLIGEDTEEIKSGAFANTPKLEAIVVDDDNEKFDDEFGVLYSKDKTDLIAVPAAKTGAIPINPNVDTVYDYAFADSKLSDAYFIGNAPKFNSANGTDKHTFERSNTTIRHNAWNFTWYNPVWVKDTFIDKPFKDGGGRIAPYNMHAHHLTVVTKKGIEPTETGFGLTDELRCRICGMLVQEQTKIWPNGKKDTGVYSFDAITSVPDSLKNNEKYDTVQKIKDVLKQETAAEYNNKTSKTMPDSSYKSYDVKPVMGSSSGPYIVTIPYPTGIGPDHYDFVCVHLNNNGNIEKLDVFETNRGLQVTVSDLSPFGFAWYYNDVDP